VFSGGWNERRRAHARRVFSTDRRSRRASEEVVAWLLLLDAAANRADQLMREAFIHAGGSPPSQPFFRPDAFVARLRRFTPNLLGDDKAAYGPMFQEEASRIAVAVIEDATRRLG